MRKKIIFSVILVLIISLIFCFSARFKTIKYEWYEPTVETSNMPYIAETVKPYLDALKTAEMESTSTNAPIKLMYLLLYGSSITKNNPMPNDIDCSTHIFVGEYDYNGNNEKEIASSIVDRIEKFYYLSFLNADKLSNIYPYKKADKIYASQNKYHNIITDSIAKHFSAAINGKPYLLNTETQIDKKFPDFTTQYALLEPDTIVLKNEFYSTFFFSDSIIFNKKTLKYIRSLTDHPVFYVKINYNGKSKYIQIISDKLSSKAFAPHEDIIFNIVLVGSDSKTDITNLYSLKDNDLFLLKRRRAYETHLKSLNNESAIKLRTLKMYKRLLQCAMIVKQYIGNKSYSEIYDFISEYQNNRDVQLINDFENICDNMLILSTSTNLYLTMQKNGKFKSTYNKLLAIIDEMDKRGNIRLSSVRQYRYFVRHDLLQFITLKDTLNLKNELKTIKKTFEGEIFEYIYSDYRSLIKDPNKLNKHIQTIEKPYIESGFHEVKYYWINSNTIGIIKDDFTSKIKDKNKFIKENNLPPINIQFVNLPDNIYNSDDSDNENEKDKDIIILYRMYARYNPTQNENEHYEKLKKSFLECLKKDFKYQGKTIFLR